jgi:hypothetical protein
MDSMTTTLRDDVAARGRANALRLADLVRSLDRRAATAVVPGLGWTAVETAAHVVNLYGRGLGDLRRSGSPEGTAELNAICLEEYVDRDPQVVADRIVADASTVWDVVLPMLPDDLELAFHAGARTTVVPIMAVLLLEMLVHGDDIARAAGRPWEIDDDDAWRALTEVASLLGAWRRPEVPARDTVALLGPGDDAIRITCSDDEVAVTVEAVRSGDRVVDEPPSVALLAVLGRRPATGALADLAARFGPF